MGGHWALGRRAPARVRDGLRLSANEERYVLAETMTSAVYAIPWVLHLRGPLDEARLAAALAYMCRRNEAFRTGFEPAGDGTFRKYVERDGAFDLKCIDASRRNPAAALHELFFSKPDLTPASLRRIALVRHAPDDHELALGFHHSIVDGQSLRVFVRELFEHYASSAEAPPPLQFSDVVDGEWRESEAYAQGQAYFAGLLSDFQPGAGVPEDRYDPELKDTYGYASVVLDAGVLEKAKAGAEAIGVSLFTYFYAVTNIALSRLIGSDGIVSAFQSNGRRRFPDSEAVIGAFSNAIVLPTRLRRSESLRDYSLRLHAEVRAAIANEAFPYHRIISEYGVHPSIGMNWYPALTGLTADGLAVSAPSQTERQSDYDLNFRFLRLHDRLEIAVYFRPGRVQAARVRQLVETIGALAGLFADGLDRPISAHPSREFAASGLLPDPVAALGAGGGTLIHSRFLAAANARPDATALAFGAGTYSYGEVEARSRALALALRGRGVGKGDRVAIVAERHPSLVWTVLAVCRTGAAFAILDSRYPARRLADLTRLALREPVTV